MAKVVQTVKDAVSMIVIKPFRHGPALTRRLMLTLLLNQTLLALIYSMIPFLFYRPTFYCSDPATGLKVPCSELQACAQPVLDYRSDYAFSSIPLDFRLFCADRKTEATVLTVMMLGHFFGAVLATLLAPYGSTRRGLIRVMIGSNLLYAVSGLLMFTAQSLLAIQILLFFASAGMDIANSFINCVPGLFYPPNMSKKVLGLQIASWPFYTIFLSAFYWLVGGWRTLLTVFLGLPTFLVCYLFYKEMDELAVFRPESHEDIRDTTSIDDSPQEILLVNLNTSTTLEGVEYQAQKIVTKEQQISSQQHVSFQEIINSPYFKVICIYFFAFGGSCVSAFSSFVTLGTLQGNIYLNLSLVTIIEMTLSLGGNFLSHYLSIRKTLIALYLFMGLGYTLFPVLPGALQSVVIVQGKLLTDLTWVLWGVFTFMLIPQKYLSVTFTVRALYCLCLYVILPYTRYYLQSIGLRVFAFSGIYELFAAVAIYSLAEKSR